MTSLERAQSASGWLKKSLLSYLALYIVSFLHFWTFGILYLCFIGIIAKHSYSLFSTLSFGTYYAVLALTPFGLGMLIPVVYVFKNGVIWRRSIKSLSLDLPEGMVFDRSSVLDADGASHHAKLQAVIHLQKIPFFIQSAVVRRGYLYYLR